MSSGPDQTWYGTLRPDYYEPVLLAEALQMPTGHVLDLVVTLIPLGYGFPLGYGRNHDDDHDDDHAYGDENSRRSGKAAGRRDVLITAFDKGPEAPGICTRIFKLRHAHDFSCSGRW
jgi:hypothetical protein